MEAYRSGDRVPYVIVHRKNAEKLFEKSEDPAYCREHAIPVDYGYYLEKQLWGPIERLLTPFPAHFREGCRALVRGALQRIQLQVQRDVYRVFERNHSLEHFFRAQPSSAPLPTTAPERAAVRDGAPHAPARKKQRTLGEMLGSRA